MSENDIFAEMRSVLRQSEEAASALNEHCKELQEIVAYLETGRRMIPASHQDAFDAALASVSDRKIEEMARAAGDY